MNDSEAQKHELVCPASLGWMLDNPLRRWLHNPRSILSGLVKEGQTVLDLGCGPGYFSIAMAEMVGASGRVISVDLQPEMLAFARQKAARRGLLPRMVFHRSTPQRIGLDQPVDFALAFWMLHEVSTPEAFLLEVSQALKPGARFLVVEPVMHVSAESFQRTILIISQVGLISRGEPHVRISRAALFEKSYA